MQEKPGSVFYTRLEALLIPPLGEKEPSSALAHDDYRKPEASAHSEQVGKLRGHDAAATELSIHGPRATD